MAKFQTDLRDIYFNLFEQLGVHKNTDKFAEGDLKEIIEQFNKFVENEIYPTRQKSDEEGVKLVNGKVVVSECLRKANKLFYENGWFGLGYPEEMGGIPVPEAVSLACTSICNGANVAYSMYPGLSKACMNVIIKAGSNVQKEMFVPKMFSGEWGGTMCLTEPGAGSDVGALKSTAAPMGDGRYKIKGIKIFISSGESDLYSNNIHLVLAKTPGAPDNAKGLSLFIVPRFLLEDGKTNNVVCSKLEHKMGIHASATCELQFGVTGETYGEMIGKEFDGMATMFIMMNEARLLCGMQGESQANLAYHLTVQYAKERVQFANEIVKHPDVRRMLLRMRSISRGMRALNFYTMNLFDEAHKGDSSVQDEIALLTPICKAFCSEEGFNVAVEAMQVHGGYGFCTEYGIEQFARDTKIATIYEGTNGIQSVDFVMRKILKDQGKAFSLLGEKMRKDLTSSEAQVFAVEISTMGKNMEQAQKILGHFAGLAQKKQFDQILQSTNYFLQFSGNLVVAWLLLRSAILANRQKGGASKDDAQYYQTKVDDFKIFCQHHLTRNSGHSLSILNFDNLYSGMEL